MRKFLITLIPAVVLLTACEPVQADNKEEEARKSEEAANSIKFTENAERDNIVRKLKLTSNPGQIGYVVLFNQAGQAIAYYGVKGKITSSGKRLTPPVKEWSLAGQTNTVNAAPSDEGTWGSSDDYVYFWTTGGQYIQWKGNYLYSDKPLRLKVDPLVVSVVE